jgi:transglutaminase-like putative cysteine protease
MAAHPDKTRTGWKNGGRGKSSATTSSVSILTGRYRGFRYLLATLVSLSIGAACIENGLHQSVLLVLPLLIVALLRPDFSRPFFFSEGVITVLFLLYLPLFSLGILIFYGNLSLPLFIVYFTFGTIVARVLSPLTDRNVPQLIFLSIGLILINCILTNHLIFGLILPFYLFALMGTMLSFHLARNAAPENETPETPSARGFSNKWHTHLVKYVVFSVILTVFMFVVLPRPFLTMPGLRTAMARTGGLADLEQQITYREMASMSGRQRIAFVVNVESGALPEIAYWRGRVLEKTDGRGWSTSEKKTPMTKRIHADPSESVLYRFIPYRLHSKMVYAAGLPVRVTGRMGGLLYITSAGEVIIDSPFLFAESYMVRAVDRPVPVTRKSEPINLDRTGVTPRIQGLAEQWTAGFSSPRDRAGVLVSRLRSRFRYALRTVPPPEEVHPIEHFLFKSRAGNCEYFAGALCFMLRSIGIPARVVEGFLGVERTEQPNEFIVRFSRAHAWVEADLGDGNWTTLDATPPGRETSESYLWRLAVDLYDSLDNKWTKNVIYFDRSDQAMIFEAFTKLVSGQVSLPFAIPRTLRSYAVPIIIGALVLSIAALIILRSRRKEAGFPGIYVMTMRDLVKKGILPHVHPWHEQNVAEIIERSPSLKDPVLKFMDCYLNARFGSSGKLAAETLKRKRKELLDTVARFASTSKRS